MLYYRCSFQERESGKGHHLNTQGYICTRKDNLPEGGEHFSQIHQLVMRRMTFMMF
jgi:hypothetical protein